MTALKVLADYAMTTLALVIALGIVIGSLLVSVAWFLMPLVGVGAIVWWLV